LIGGYVGSTALMTATGTATGRYRVALLAGFAFVGVLLLDLISGAFAWGWPIHQFWPLWPIMALVVAAVALFASVLQKLIGSWGTLLTIILLILRQPFLWWDKRSCIPAELLARHRAVSAGTERTH
jgi:hypothetical protein